MGVKGEILLILKHASMLRCYEQAQCFTWWYLPILTWECLRIMPSVGRSYKEKKGQTLPPWTQLTVVGHWGTILYQPLPSAASAGWTSLLRWAPPEPLVYPNQYQTPAFYICMATRRKNKLVWSKSTFQWTKLSTLHHELYSLCRHCTWSSHSEPW